MTNLKPSKNKFETARTSRLKTGKHTRDPQDFRPWSQHMGRVWVVSASKIVHVLVFILVLTIRSSIISATKIFQCRILVSFVETRNDRSQYWSFIFRLKVFRLCLVFWDWIISLHDLWNTRIDKQEDRWTEWNGHYSTCCQTPNNFSFMFWM